MSEVVINSFRRDLKFIDGEPELLYSVNFTVNMFPCRNESCSDQDILDALKQYFFDMSEE